MELTKEELEKIRIYAKLEHKEDRYVWLRKDDKGTYIEYAFKEGAPHDNRCLSWYNSLQPNAIERNEKAFGFTDPECIQHEIERVEKKIESKINGLFRLTSFTCGHEEYPKTALERSRKSWEEYHDEPFVAENHICRVGCPAPNCIKNKTCANWTYKEPVKCACWDLDEVEVPLYVTISLDDALKLESTLKN